MADIHTFEGEDIVETLAAQAEGHEPGELGALAYHLYDTNPELTEEEAFEAFTNWVADRGIRAVASPGGGAHVAHGGRPRHLGHAHGQRQKPGRAGHALHGHVLW